MTTKPDVTPKPKPTAKNAAGAPVSAVMAIAKSRPKKPVKPREKLETLGIEWVCERITDGQGMSDIAAAAGVSFGTMATWIHADPERSARTREARRETARLWDEMAQKEIAKAKEPFELSRAKELAHHYRWRASKIAPREYGDKLAVGGADDLPPIGVRSMTDAERAVRLSRILNGSPYVLAGLIGALKGKA